MENTTVEEFSVVQKKDKEGEKDYLNFILTAKIRVSKIKMDKKRILLRILESLVFVIFCGKK